MRTVLPRSTQLSQSLDGVQNSINQMVDKLYVVELRKSLPSRVQAISPFVAEFMRVLANFRITDPRELEIEMALLEALANAVVHGNHGDPNKFVHVVCRCRTDGQISVNIKDEGRGFDIHAVPDPVTADNLLSERGRGIFLMRAVMDEVSFSDGGTAVHMRKKLNIVQPHRGKRNELTSPPNKESNFPTRLTQKEQ
jgi:serine/threonine-protein kinase RsbW